MTGRTSWTGVEQSSAPSVADRGLRHLVVAGAARIERVEAAGPVPAWHHVDREWARRSGWRSRQPGQEEVADEQQE